jgi:hypothetical protein
MKMSVRGRIINVRYDQRLAQLQLIYEGGIRSEVDLLKFGNLPFDFAESFGRKMERFEILSDGKSVHFPDLEMTYTEED